jgi:hypothetical protein
MKVHRYHRRDGRPPEPNGEVRRYLVVGNVTLAGETQMNKVRECLAAGPCRFHLVVPASPSPHTLTWTEEQARATARRRLDQALAAFGALGAEVTGEVGDGMPLLAIDDACRVRVFDEVIVSTLPPRMSRWLKLDLPHRVANRFGLPVTHLIAWEEASLPVAGQ